jgi:hypothetical protein
MPAPLLFPLLRGRMAVVNSLKKGVAPILGNKPMPVQPKITITGVTRDNVGAALGNCVVELYRRNQDQTQGTFVERTISDGAGNFSFSVGLGQQYQHISYQVGAPDKAGVSVRTLVGA